MEAPILPTQHSDSLARFLVGRAVFVLALAAVLYCTLHPFVFVWSRAHSLRQIASAFDLQPISSGGWHDFFANVALFTPLGFGFAGLTRHWPHRRAMVIAIVGCGLLSATVETLQVFLPGRDSAVGDVIANTLGGLLGFALQNWFGLWIGSHLARAIRKKSGALSRKVLVIALLLYAVGLASVLWHYSRRLRISGWDDRYWLMVGNEHSGDRPWRGTVSELAIAPRMISAEATSKLFDGAKIADVLPASLLAAYNLNNGIDAFGHLPRLNPRGTSATDLTQSQWLESEVPAGNLANAVNQSSAMTIVVTAASMDLNQTGPARIVSFSSGVLDRNLMLGQDGQNLFVRMRTPLTDGGGRPEFVVPAVFVDKNPHRIVVACDGRRLRVWIDTITRRYGLDITPDIALFWRIRPPGDREIRLDASIRHVPYLVFRACALLPAGLLLALLISACRRRLEFWFMVTMAIIVAPAILEVGLAMLSHQPVLTERWIGSTTVMAVCAVGAFWRPVRPNNVSE